MKYLTFAPPEEPENHQVGLLHSDRVISLASAQAWASEERQLPHRELPDNMFELICGGEEAQGSARALLSALEGKDPFGLQTRKGSRVGYRLEDVHLLPPLLRPMSLRDFYAFEAHVSAANTIRGRSVPEEWYQFPVFYFTNPNTIFGPEDLVPHPSYTQAMDYELEVACIIGKAGINIAPEKALEHIFGFTIFNDWSARDIQRKEMKVGLGPAKGKDFASSLGPYIVTPDELSDRSTGRPGVYDLKMKARVNGKEYSSGNWKDLHYSFGEMIARASHDVYLLPGEVLGSGTVGTGCLLELTQAQGPWLQPGDTVELEVEKLGVLRNVVSEIDRKQS
jgi:fumarylacetoacetate (FAA) hydrolase